MSIPSISSIPPLLNPPPRPNALRARASSTSLRPPLSLTTLSSRSRAGSFVGTEEREPEAESACSESTSWSATSSRDSSTHELEGIVLPSIPVERVQRPSTSLFSMFPVLVSRTVELVRALRPGASTKEKASLFETPLASPRSSTDTEYILPLSASHVKTSFDEVDLTPPPHIRAFFHLSSFPSVHVPLLLVIILFPLSTGLVFLCLSTLPISFAWPRTLSDLSQIGRELNTYAQSGLGPTAHIFAVLSVSAVWKHAWSIPGSVLWNVLAGALFHPLLATFVMTLLTSLGSVFSTLLAMPLAPTLSRVFPRPVEITRQALDGQTSSTSSAEGPMTVQSTNCSASSSSSDGTPAWVRLSVLRLVGIVPWSALNIACGITGVSLRNCFLGALVGTLPWTAVTCQIGDILHTVGVVRTNTGTEGEFGEGLSNSATLSQVLASPQIIMELIFLSVLSLAPVLGRKQLSRFISSAGETSTADQDDGEELIEKECSTPASGMEEDLESDKYDHRGRGRKVHHQQWTWKRISMSVPRWSRLHLQRETLVDEHLDR